VFAGTQASTNDLSLKEADSVAEYTTMFGNKTLLTAVAETNRSLCFAMEGKLLAVILRKPKRIMALKPTTRVNSNDVTRRLTLVVFLLALSTKDKLYFFCTRFILSQRQAQKHQNRLYIHAPRRNVAQLITAAVIHTFTAGIHTPQLFFTYLQLLVTRIQLAFAREGEALQSKDNKQ